MLDEPLAVENAVDSMEAARGTPLERLCVVGSPRPQDDVLGASEDDVAYRPYGEADFTISGADSWNEMLASLEQRTAEEGRRSNAARANPASPLGDPDCRYWRSVPDERGLLSDWDPLERAFPRDR